MRPLSAIRAEITKNEQYRAELYEEAQEVDGEDVSFEYDLTEKALKKLWDELAEAEKAFMSVPQLPA